MSPIQIEVENCNNIDSGVISLAEHKLNIKFAPNGTGKSTIAKAILFGAKGGQNPLSELIPFKLKKDNPDNKQPEVRGAEGLNPILCFNEEYVSQFVFKPNELLSNSFDILIRTDAYKQKEMEIEGLVAKVKELFLGNTELEKLISTLKEMSGAFKLSKSGIAKTSPGMKGLLGGNKIAHVPAGLEAYTPFIQSPNSVDWIEWQTKGNDFSELSEKCPFCTSDATTKMEQIKKVGQEYDKSTIKNLIAIIGVIRTLGDYFSEEAKVNLEKISDLKDGLGKEHVDFLVSVKTQIDNFTEKLENLKTLSAFQFKDGEKVAAKLPQYKLDLQFFSELNSAKMREAIAPINASIEEMVEKAGQLQGAVNQQLAQMKSTVEQHQKNINDFLAYAGFRYQVAIVGDGEQAQLKLRHSDHGEHLNGGNQHLSFGERNAFAIVLFMYECLAKKPNLIILDDPISSFDKNKKYAILEMLFRRDASACLKNKTVLMLTHDVEPIIDTVKSLAHKFGNQTSASFLRLHTGVVTELAIRKEDIRPFASICHGVVSSPKNDIVKLIYLRRHHEIASDTGDAYQVLSNLFHGRREPGIDTREPKDASGQYPEMTDAKFNSGCKQIVDSLPGFEYTPLLGQVTNRETIKGLYAASGNGYEKLQLFRLLDIKVANSVIQKFINETYHIENEFICQLDPSQFDMIPEYVIVECDKMIAEALP